MTTEETAADAIDKDIEEEEDKKARMELFLADCMNDIARNSRRLAVCPACAIVTLGTVLMAAIKRGAIKHLEDMDEQEYEKSPFTNYERGTFVAEDGSLSLSTEFREKGN